MIIQRVVFSLVLFAGAGFSWAEARRGQSAADARERLVTFRQDAADEHAALYWRGQYDEVLKVRGTQQADADANALLLAANAAYRASQRQPAAATDTSALDLALQGYATVLRASGFHRDAAYNYEYVARLRDRIARERKSRPTAAPRPATPTVVGGDLPAGPTIHGRPGAHPVDPKGKEFEILTPMEFGEREAQPEQTPGRKLPRKG